MKIRTYFIIAILFNLLPLTTLADEIYYCHTDNFGTVMAMTDENGDVVWRTDELPFGEDYQQPEEMPIKNDRRFLGKQLDEKTGLIYMGARYFDPGTGRFNRPDPVGLVDPATGKINQEMLLNPQRQNRYVYGLNNPYRFVDPDGEFAITATLAIIGTTAALLTTNPDVANAPAVGEATQHSNGAAGIITEGAAAIGTGYVGGKILGKIASRGRNPLAGTEYTDKVLRQMKGKDLDHNFPSLVDKQAGAARVKKITGGDGIERTKVELPGSINGKNGNYSWIIEPNKKVNHRQFERSKKK